MNYTERYRLPQWEKQDRVLMEDFNRMCADIDAGMSADADKAFRVLRRHAYNTYHAAAALAPFPRQLGSFHQNMDPIPANASGFWQRDGFAWLGAGETVTPASLKAAIVQSSPFQIGTSYAQNKTMVLEFTAPGAALLENLTFQDPNFKGTFTMKTRVTIRDLTAGTTEFDDYFTNSTNGSIAYAHWLLQLPVYFRTGHRYRFEMAAAGTIPAGTGSETLQYNAGEEWFTVRLRDIDNPSGTAAYTLREEEGSPCGMVLVRFQAGEDDGTIRLDWDGVTYAPAFVHTIPWPDGKMYQEAVFYREDGIPAESQMTLRLECSESGTMSLYDWGAALI